MTFGDGSRLRIAAQDGSGEASFRVRVVTIADGRLGCVVPDRLARLVERDPRGRLEDGGPVSATVVRSGRLFAEVHGRLRAARRLPSRDHDGPVLLVERE